MDSRPTQQGRDGRAAKRCLCRPTDPERARREPGVLGEGGEDRAAEEVHRGAGFEKVGQRIEAHARPIQERLFARGRLYSAPTMPAPPPDARSFLSEVVSVTPCGADGVLLALRKRKATS